jgi:citrate lyase subunit beta/citryl-CoA lyase
MTDAFATPTSRGPARSVLFAPANHARRVERALTSGADIVVLDLEDAVPWAEKAAARAALATVLCAATHPRLYVRINATSSPEYTADLSVVVGGHLEGIVVPKVESAVALRELETALTVAEQAQRRATPPLAVMPIIETAKGVVHCEAIAAAATRVSRLIFGAADYSLDMNLSLEWSEDEQELLYARAKIAHASRAADLEAPIDTATLQVRDLERFLRSARNGQRLGYQGKLCLHPDQIAPCHAVFTPSEAEIQHAKRVLSAYARAKALGSAAIEVDGQFVDEPVAERARRVLQRAGLQE